MVRSLIISKGIIQRLEGKQKIQWRKYMERGKKTHEDIKEERKKMKTGGNVEIKLLKLIKNK